MSTLGVVVISLAAVGTGAFYVMRKKKQTSDGTPPPDAVETVTPESMPDSGVTAANSFEDKVMQFARGIAFAEGFGVAGKIPTIYHNPGDLKPVDGTAFYFTGQTGVGTGGHAVFQNDAAGWNALFHQVRLMITNKSSVYNSRMTIEEIAKQYAELSANWSKNVSSFLKVSPKITLEEFFYGK